MYQKKIYLEFYKLELGRKNPLDEIPEMVKKKGAGR